MKDFIKSYRELIQKSNHHNSVFSLHFESESKSLFNDFKKTKLGKEFSKMEYNNDTYFEEFNLLYGISIKRIELNGNFELIIKNLPYQKVCEVLNLKLKGLFRIYLTNTTDDNGLEFSKLMKSLNEIVFNYQKWDGNIPPHIYYSRLRGEKDNHNFS